jgi:hypothetical protein
MRETLPTPEASPEQFKEIALEVKGADGVHGFEIFFDENDTKLVTVYNVAIAEICKDLGIFHQTGRTNDPGYHAWEVLGSKVDTEKLTALLPAIQQKAQEYYLKFSKLKII